MTNEYFKIKIEKITKGEREQDSYEKVYESDNPIFKEVPTIEQYVRKKIIKNYVDSVTVFEQITDTIDLTRVIRALNKDI